MTPALWEGIHTRIKEEQTARSSSFLSRLNGWFALVFSAPRFSPALAIVLMFVAIGLTVGVMRYVNSRGNRSGPQVANKNNDQTAPNALTKLPDSGQDVNKD